MSIDHVESRAYIILNGRERAGGDFQQYVWIWSCCIFTHVGCWIVHHVLDLFNSVDQKRPVFIRACLRYARGENGPARSRWWSKHSLEHPHTSHSFTRSQTSPSLFHYGSKTFRVKVISILGSEPWYRFTVHVNNRRGHSDVRSRKFSTLLHVSDATIVNALSYVLLL